MRASLYQARFLVVRLEEISAKAQLNGILCGFPVLFRSGGGSLPPNVVYLCFERKDARTLP